MTQLPPSQAGSDTEASPDLPRHPGPTAASATPTSDDVETRYHRVVRRARWRRLIPLLGVGAALYLPLMKGEARFLGLDHLSWSDAVQKTILWLLIMAFLWMLPLEWNPAPSGYQGLDREGRAIVDAAVDTASPPQDAVLRRVADEYAKRVMRAGEPGRNHVIGFVVAGVVACALATQWWALFLWLSVLALGARNTWKRRGRATQAERYLTVPR